MLWGLHTQVNEILSAYMVRFFSCVNAQVTLERLQVPETRPADVAGVWLLSRVDQHVGAQVSHLDKQINKQIKKKNK